MLQRKKASAAFTLSELLIALAILGVLATFAVPKILSSQQNAQTASVCKETLSVISDVLYRGVQGGEITGTTIGQIWFVRDYFFSHINLLKTCPTNGTGVQGCWDTTLQGAGEASAGFVMHNGATITGINNTNPSGNDDGWDVDCNGTAGPNQHGTDQIRIYLCFPGSPFSCAATLGPKVAGTIGPDAGADKTFYSKLFSN